MPASSSAAQELLAKLVAFDTTSAKSNLKLIEFVRDYLADHGVSATLTPSPDGRKASLFATIGRSGMSGIARILLGMGHQVTGSDLRDTSNVAALRELGATIHIGHDAEIEHEQMDGNERYDQAVLLAEANDHWSQKRRNDDIVCRRRQTHAQDQAQYRG